MRQIISIFFALVLAIGFASPASAFVLGFAADQNGNFAIGIGISANQTNQYSEPRPRNQWNAISRRSEHRQSNRWQRPDSRSESGSIECKGNISYDRHLGYVDQSTGRPCK